MNSSYDPSGKFARISTGDLQLPGMCGSCGKIDEPGGFVDTTLQFEFYGALVFCVDCAFEMTSVFPEAPYHTMRDRILALESDIIAKDATIASLERALDGITSVRLTDRGIDPSNFDSGILNDATIQDEPEPDDVTDVDDSGTAFVESILAESVKSAGPVHTTKPERSDPILDL